MKMKQVPIGEATESELRDFARSHLGMEIQATAKHETVRSRVTAAWDKPEIFVPEAEAPVAQTGPKPQPVTEGQQAPNEGYVRIHMPASDKAGGSDDVFVSVNGVGMTIPRGKDCDIPVRYFHALNNAVQHIYDPMPDGGISPIPRKVHLYPFQRVA